MKPKYQYFLKVISLITLLICENVWAGLGEASSKTAMDAKYRHVNRIKAASNSKFHVVQLVSGSEQILEYVDSTDTVFAVTWSGNNLPDLNKLLGTDCASEHSRALENRSVVGSSRRFGVFEGDVCYVTRGSIGGQHTGKAILKAKIPPGVSINEIQ